MNMHSVIPALFAFSSREWTNRTDLGSGNPDLGAVRLSIQATSLETGFQIRQLSTIASAPI